MWYKPKISLIYLDIKPEEAKAKKPSQVHSLLTKNPIEKALFLSHW